MDIFIYRNNSDMVELQHSVDIIPQLLKDENVVFWVDFEAPTEEDDKILLNVFHFHPLTIEDCRANVHHP